MFELRSCPRIALIGTDLIHVCYELEKVTPIVFKCNYLSLTELCRYKKTCDRFLGVIYCVNLSTENVLIFAIFKNPRKKYPRN